MAIYVGFLQTHDLSGIKLKDEQSNSAQLAGELKTSLADAEEMKRNTKHLEKQVERLQKQLASM